MSDELTQAPEEEVQDTPAEGAPDAGTRTEEESINWEKRFKDLQPELTKAQQEAARLRAIDEGLRNPERAAEILEQYGYSFGDEVPDPEGEGAEQVDDPRVAAHDEWIQQQQQERVMSEFNSHLDSLAGDPKLLDEYDRQVILSNSVANGFNKEATEEAFEAWKKREDAKQKKAVENYIASKRNAPFVSPGGTGATEVPDLDDGPTRRQWLAEKLAAAEALD